MASSPCLLLLAKQIEASSGAVGVPAGKRSLSDLDLLYQEVLGVVDV